MLLVSVLLSCTARVGGPLSGPGDVVPEDTRSSLPATVGVLHPVLKTVLLDHWSSTMERYPTWATELGDRRFDDRLFDPSERARSAWAGQQRAWLLRLSTLPRDTMAESDRLHLSVLAEDLEAALGTEVCRFDTWSVSARSSALTFTNGLAEAPRLETPEDAASLLARYRALPAYIAGVTANLQRGLERDRVGNRESIEKVVAMVAEQLRLPVAESPLMRPAQTPPKGLSTEEAEAWRSDLQAAVRDDIRPALSGYLQVLREQVLPRARTGTDVGLHALPDGDACYAGLIRSYTTLPKGAQELHDLGLAELASIHAEFRTIGQRALGTNDLAQIFERLRTDPELRFDNADEVVQAAEDALARAKAAIPGYFGRLPEAACVVEPIPDYLAPYTTIAYYQPARPDGTRPGIYFVNTHEPTTRPRHEAEVLAFHESIPGHHHQIAIAQELDELPSFRRYSQTTAFVEGWGLYIERLADEMGLYSGDLDRLGMLSFDAWRASRLVVDTGVHALGWSREQAETFMVENTPLARNNIANEVDRYITTPGQALAYKVGQLEIRGMRASAEDQLGPAFDLSTSTIGFLETALYRLASWPNVSTAGSRPSWIRLRGPAVRVRRRSSEPGKRRHSSQPAQRRQRALPR